MFFETFSSWLPISPYTNVVFQFKGDSVVGFQFKIALGDRFIHQRSEIRFIPVNETCDFCHGEL
jgi:hypothetical protein